MIDNYSENFLIEVLTSVKSIAIVGASKNHKKDSFKVMQVLLENDYKVFPVNPNEKGGLILGQYCYENLESIDDPIDMVDIFRSTDAVLEIAEQAIEVGAKVLWTQLNIIHIEAASMAEQAGLKVVMNRCPKIELSKDYWTKNKN